jgi:hypothetical protein
MTEKQLQIQIVTWLKMDNRIMFWATSNERKAKPQHMAALKRMGVLSGVSDLILLTSKGPTFVELKRPTTYKINFSGKRIIDVRGGMQSLAQKDFQASVEKLGFDYHLIDNFDDFKKIILKGKI